MVVVCLLPGERCGKCSGRRQPVRSGPTLSEPASPSRSRTMRLCGSEITPAVRHELPPTTSASAGGDGPRLAGAALVGHQGITRDHTHPSPPQALGQTFARGGVVQEVRLGHRNDLLAIRFSRPRPNLPPKGGSHATTAGSHATMAKAHARLWKPRQIVAVSSRWSNIRPSSSVRTTGAYRPRSDAVPRQLSAGRKTGTSRRH
jgi:hypothetical protein